MGGMSKMTKKFIRNTMIGFCVFIAVIIITYVAVTYLYKASAAKPPQAFCLSRNPRLPKPPHRSQKMMLPTVNIISHGLTARGSQSLPAQTETKNFCTQSMSVPRIFQQMNSQSSKRESSSPTSRPSPHLKKTLPDRALL